MRRTLIAAAVATVASSAIDAHAQWPFDAPEYCPSAEDVRDGDLNAEHRPRLGDFKFKSERIAEAREQVVRFEEVIVKFNEPIEEELPSSVQVTCVYRTKLVGADREWIDLEIETEPVSELELVAISLGLVSYPLSSKYYSRACNCYAYTCRKRRFRCPF